MSKMYTIRPIYGRGRGMFSDKEIKAGTRILADELLFSIKDNTIDEGIGKRIAVSLGRLLPEQQQQFEALHCPYCPTRTPLVSRYIANCFEAGAGRSGIFLEAARINNSCCPNAFFSWNQKLKCITIHAIMDIPAAEEITVCYIFPFYSLRSRQDIFHDYYGFECDCPTCNFETAAAKSTELRRQKMEKLYLAVEKGNGGPSSNDQKELERVLEFIELAEADGLDGEFLSCLYRRARECYEEMGSKELALKYAEMEVETDRRLLGEDHPVTRESVGALKGLKARLAMVQQVE